MAPIINPTVIFNEIPEGYPEPGKHIVYSLDRTIDLENVRLDGGVLVEVICVSNDPYLRGKMRDPSIESYAPAYILGEPLYNYGVARVLRSEHPNVKEGQHVTNNSINFQKYSIIPKDAADKLQILENKEKLPWSVFIGAAGMPGRTAYFGYKEHAKAKKGETIFVSTGAGAVGSMVIQLAKLDGLRVIGSAGSDEKVAWMKKIGADVAFNYKTTSTDEVLKKDGGIDIYWDNVGGSTLDAALGNLRLYGRIIACGMITQYNSQEPTPIKNLDRFFGQSLSMNGFLEWLLAPKWIDAFYRDIAPKLASGEILYAEEITHGLANAGAAILRIQKGENVGKSIIVVKDEAPAA